MPGIKSASNLRVVRENFPNIRVVVVSSSQDRHDVMAALAAGVHGYVPKSLGPAELAHALGLILQGCSSSVRELAAQPETSTATASKAPQIDILIIARLPSSPTLTNARVVVSRQCSSIARRNPKKPRSR